MVFLGIGQGGALGLGLILPVLRGRDPGQVAGMTAMAMGVGYLIAAAGPALVGAVRDATGDWTWPLDRAARDDGARGPGGAVRGQGSPAPSRCTQLSSISRRTRCARRRRGRPSIAFSICPTAPVAGRRAPRGPCAESATSTTRPWLAAGERTIRPSASSEPRTSFIDCGVT